MTPLIAGSRLAGLHSQVPVAPRGVSLEGRKVVTCCLVVGGLGAGDEGPELPGGSSFTSSCRGGSVWCYVALGLSVLRAVAGPLSRSVHFLAITALTAAAELRLCQPQLRVSEAVWGHYAEVQGLGNTLCRNDFRLKVCSGAVRQNLAFIVFCLFKHGSCWKMLLCVQAQQCSFSITSVSACLFAVVPVGFFFFPPSPTSFLA